MMGSMCAKCQKMSGLLFLLVGVAFLLQNLGVWSFWNLQWYTVLFLLWGCGSLGHAGCKDCQKMCK